MHILIIGGTGMLTEASQYFALKNNSTVTTISRKKIFSEAIKSISCDYSNTEKFLQTIEKIHQKQTIDKIIVWMHSYAKDSCSKLFEFAKNHHILFFHILGSVAYKPVTTNQEWRNWQKNEIYKQILLGFKIENNRSRWLTNTEISKGTILAVEKNQNQIIGQISPWEMRP